MLFNEKTIQNHPAKNPQITRKNTQKPAKVRKSGFLVEGILGKQPIHSDLAFVEAKNTLFRTVAFRALILN